LAEQQPRPKPRVRRKANAAAAAPAAPPKRVRKAKIAPAVVTAHTSAPPLPASPGGPPHEWGGFYELLWSSGLTKVGTLAGRELSSYFISPVGYVIAALMVPIVSLFAFLPAVLSGAPVAMDRVYGGLAYLLAFMAPFFTMRLLAEESRSGTLELLLTSPLRDWEVVIGKWLGALLFFITITAFLFLFAAVIMYYEPTHQVISVAGISLSVGNLDLGPTLTGYLGILLEAGALLALGLLCSSLTQNQILAAFVGLVVTLSLVWVFGLGNFLPSPFGDIAQYIGAYDHFASFNQGRIVLRDLVYFLTVTGGALFLTVRVLESRRWR